MRRKSGGAGLIRECCNTATGLAGRRMRRPRRNFTGIYHFIYDEPAQINSTNICTGRYCGRLSATKCYYLSALHYQFVAYLLASAIDSPPRSAPSTRSHRDYELNRASTVCRTLCPPARFIAGVPVKKSQILHTLNQHNKGAIVEWRSFEEVAQTHTWHPMRNGGVNENGQLIELSRFLPN